jgi:hypothetical protein
MLERQNYLKVKLFLKFSRDVQGCSLAHKSSDFDCLKFLLRWAGQWPLGAASGFTPTLPDYLYLEAGQVIQCQDVKRILGTSQRFFLWAKAMFPVEFQGIRLSWIMNLNSIPERKEVIF